MNIEYQSNGQPIAVDFEDLREKLGYRVYKPRIGNVGKALFKAIKEGNQRSISWLKHQLDELSGKKMNRKKKEDKKNKKWHKQGTKQLI